MFKDSFLLRTDISKTIYENIRQLPIIDYHCHLSPKEIADNKRFQNITEIWLGGDHYKWRLMRANGIDEKYITGNTSDYDKFLKWAETIEIAIGNPLYHWTHMELQQYFQYNSPLTKESADEVWHHCNKIIQSEDFCVAGIFKKFSVESLCTTDDPIDSLEYHTKIKQDPQFNTKVLPTFRPTNLLNIEAAPYNDYIKKLSALTNIQIQSYADIVAAAHQRIDFFNENGCRLSDHSLDPVVYCEATTHELDTIVSKKQHNEPLTQKEIAQYKSSLLHDMAVKYHDVQWTMQLHMSCIRNTNTKMFDLLGPDTGYDCIDSGLDARALVSILNNLERISKLPKTILYSLNANDNDLLTTMMACFQDGQTKGKMQLGSAWWFNDQKDGMEKQMIALANNGLLANFVGMLTDSRSFLSYPRHDYFRRILCNLIGNWADSGEFINDEKQLTKIASDISYYNAKNYFEF